MSFLESHLAENNVPFYIYYQKSIRKVTVTFPGDGFWFFYCYKRSYKWSHYNLNINKLSALPLFLWYIAH